MRILHLLAVTWCVMCSWGCSAFNREGLDQCDPSFKPKTSQLNAEMIMRLLEKDERCKRKKDFWTEKLAKYGQMYKENKMKVMNYEWQNALNHTLQSEERVLIGMLSLGYLSFEIEKSINLLYPADKMTLMLCQEYSLDKSLELFNMDNVNFDSYARNLSGTIEKKLLNVTLVKNQLKLKLEPHLSYLMRTSRNYTELAWIWENWHKEASKAIQEPYLNLLTHINQQAKNNGYSGMGEKWMLKEKDNAEILKSMTEQIQSLYDKLVPYIRRKLFKFYGAQYIDQAAKYYFENQKNPIPLYLLGSLYPDNWKNIYDLVVPYPDLNLNITANMINNNITAEGMFKLVEDFYVSLGLEPMNPSFWIESIFEETPGMNMSCNPLYQKENEFHDTRVFMCGEVRYQHLRFISQIRALMDNNYHWNLDWQFDKFHRSQPYHLALVNAMSWSVDSVAYLTRVGLIGSEIDEETLKKYDINRLLQKALVEVSGSKIKLINSAWKGLMFNGAEFDEKDKLLSGLRSASHLSAGVLNEDSNAVVDIPDLLGPHSTRDIRTKMLSYEFYGALCKTASRDDPLHQCDLFDSKEVGDKIKQYYDIPPYSPRQEFMKELTGSSEYTRDSFTQYFKPLSDWLDEENEKN